MSPTADVDEKQSPPVILEDPSSPVTVLRPSASATNLEQENETIDEAWENIKRESLSEGKAPTLKMSPSGPASVAAKVEEANGRALNGNGNGNGAGTDQATMLEAWERLKRSYIYFKGRPVGTIAALDPSADALNYNRVFVRDFFPTGLAYLMKSPPEP